MLTKEIRESALLWEGEIPEHWEFIGMAENRWNRFRYYKDKKNHRFYYTVQKRPWEREFRIRTRQEGGIEYARKVPASLGMYGAG